jgi:protein-glutamine gamma-glutamyltransferase
MTPPSSLRPVHGTRFSREQRDTAFMLGLIAWTVAPHLIRLPLSIGALCCVVLLWRGWLAWREAPLPRKSALGAVLLCAATLTWFEQKTLMSRDAGVTLLVLLMSLKTLELKAHRDALVVFFLGFFLVLTQFLYSQSISTAVGMVVAVLGWLTALTLTHMPVGRPPLRQAIGIALRTTLIGIPLMVLLFVFFPRIPPLWGMPGDGARTGLSDTLRLGEVADLAQDDSVAMRLRFEGSAPAMQDLYIRGPVLTRYDGQTWQADPLRRGPSPGMPLPEDASVQAGRFHVAPERVEITFEPTRVSWLALPEFSVLSEERAVIGLQAPQDDTLQWRLRVPLAERLLVNAHWQRVRPDTPSPSRWQLLELSSLPPGVDLRTRDWARQWVERKGLKGAGASSIVQALLGEIRHGGYSYTLTPGPYDGDAIDQFWLDRKLGFCEHYASAMAVILRSLHIPARIVTGYQGADPQPVDGYWIVRQSQAHAWVEYWQEGRGWLRADPTAAVDPARVLRGQALQAPVGLMANSIDAVSPGLRWQVRRWIEAIDNRWNQWVLGYGNQQQSHLFEGWGWPELNAMHLARILVSCLAILGLVGALWAWWDARRRTPWQRTQHRLIQRLHRLGLPATPADTPALLAERVIKRWGDLGRPAAGVLFELQHARYAADTNAEANWSARRWWRRFQQATRALRRRP